MTKRPAASAKLQSAGTGCRTSSLAATLVAYPPCDAPNTLSPTLYFGFGIEEGAERITPENSEPEIHGRGGWCWYLPAICRRSKKLVAEAWIAIRYWSFVGTGSGRSVIWSSFGP